MAFNPTAIAKVQTTDRNINQLQQNILTPLNQLLQVQIVNNNILTEVSLKSGPNTINHGLQRELLGWIPVRVRSSATFYDEQDSNQNPNNTLVLVSSAAVVVDLLVF